MSTALTQGNQALATTLLRVGDQVRVTMRGARFHGDIVRIDERDRTAVVKLEDGRSTLVSWGQISLADATGIPVATVDTRGAVRKLLDLIRPSHAPLHLDAAVFCANCKHVDRKRNGVQRCAQCGTEGMLRIGVMLGAQQKALEQQTRRLEMLQAELAGLKARITHKARGKIIGVIPARVVQ